MAKIPAKKSRTLSLTDEEWAIVQEVSVADNRSAAQEIVHLAKERQKQQNASN